jgi:hypothetical protein
MAETMNKAIYYAGSPKVHVRLPSLDLKKIARNRSLSFLSIAVLFAFLLLEVFPMFPRPSIRRSLFDDLSVVDMKK